MRASQRINLLPPELRRRQVEPSLDWAVGTAMACLLLYIFGTSAFYGLQARASRTELARLEASNREIAVLLEPLLKQHQAEEHQGKQLAFIESLIDRKNRWSEAFKEFSRVLPHGVWFTGLTSVTREGERRFVVKGEAISQVKIAEFFSALDRSRLFGSASIDYAEREPNVEPEVYRFELSVPVRADKSGDSA